LKTPVLFLYFLQYCLTCDEFSTPVCLKTCSICISV
jgi:hypothetical protein